MYHTTKKIALSFLALLVTSFYSGVFAAEFAFINPLKVTSQDATSVSLSWDKLPGATGYIVYYGPKSSTWGIYDFELPDVVEENKATITGLTQWEKVYIAVSAIDSNYDEAALSKELVVTVGESKTSQNQSKPAPTTWTTPKFALKSVSVLGEQDLQLTFSNNVEDYNTSVREFVVSEKANKANQIDVVQSRVENKNQVILELGSPLEKNKEYEVVALSISDVNGKNIQSGVDGVATFTVSSTVPSSSQSMNAASNSSSSTSWNMSGGASAGTSNGSSVNPGTSGTSWMDAGENSSLSSQNSQTAENSLAGNQGNISATDADLNAANAAVVSGTTAQEAAADATALPKTWPQGIIMILLALLIGGVVVALRRKSM